MISRIRILGVDVDALTEDVLFKHIENTIRNGQRRVISNHNLHSIYLYHHDPEMREFYEKSDTILIDGMPIVFAAKLHGKSVKISHRISWTDLIKKLMSIANEQGWRVFFLGSKPGVGETAGEVFRSSNPELTYGCRHGYFDTSRNGSENRQVIEQINAFKPHVLLVGMGMPRQEKWILDNLNDLHFNVAGNVGACMDFVAGVKALPPRWLGRFGLEWTYRLAREPTRLFRRYVIEPWSLLGHLFKR